METHQLLKKYFDKKKKATPSFSLRWLSQKLEISPSFLSRIFTGEKAVPYAVLLKLQNYLDIEVEVFAGLKAAHSGKTGGNNSPRKGKAAMKTSKEDWALAGDSSLRVLSQWFYLPILEFITLGNFDGTADQIARRLGLSKTAVEIALQEMLSLGLVVLNNGRHQKADIKLRWASAKSLAEIRKFHEEMMQKALENLRGQSGKKEFDRRLITGITLTARSEKIEAAKQKLSECLYEIANDLTAEEGDQVYHLSAQLFPLTKEE